MHCTGTYVCVTFRNWAWKHSILHVTVCLKLQTKPF